MKIILSHPTGNANVRAAASGFVKAGILAEFNTSIAAFPGTFLDKLSKLRPLSELSRRRFDPALQPLTSMHPWREVGRLAASKAGFSNLVKHEKGSFCVDSVYRSLDCRVVRKIKTARRRGINSVYAYEDGALESFKAAKNLGLSCFYDLPIGYWRTARRLLKSEQAQWPDWAVTITGFQDSDAKLLRKDEELRLADRIFVASRFTAKTLQDCPHPLAPIEIIPYGFPPVAGQREYAGSLGKRALRLLFVGGLSQRKGIANLFAAVEVLGKKVSLTVVGQKTGSQCAALDAALLKHTWIPSLSHAAILQLMQQHDVFIFPSLFEGFGLVITEAMSQGTPVITTDRTAGPDLINNDENGWIVEGGSTDAILKKLDDLLSHPEQIKKAGQAAMDTASKRPWDVYGAELAKAVQRSNF